MSGPDDQTVATVTAESKVRGFPLWTRLGKPQRALVFIILGYVAVFFGMAKHCHDVFGYDSGGTAVFNSMMWNTLHGRPFHISALTTAEARKPINNLAIHAAYFWVFLLPFYALIPGPATLLFLQSLALGLSAVPVYLIARRLLKDETAAVLLGAAFILIPPIVSQNVNQIQEPSFLPVVLLFAIYFFIAQRWGPFLVLCVLSCLNRENVPLAVAMFGLWALVERRSWRWVVVPIVGGTVYFLFVTLVAMPYFREGESWHVAKQFEHLGNGPVGILVNLCTKPQLLFGHLLGADNVQYVVQLVQPMGWLLPWLHPAALLALPDLAANTLSNNSALKVIAWHYNLTTTSALFVSLIFTLRRLNGWLQQRWGCSQLVVLAAGIFLLAGAHWFLWFQPQMFRQRPYHDTLTKAIRSIPPQASVLSSFRIQAHFSSRPRYDALSVFQNYPAYARSFEYVVLDANERQFPPFITREFFESFRNNPEYELVFAENNVFVFRRPDGGAPIP
jgi:uncharacterized membrane protein